MAQDWSAAHCKDDKTKREEIEVDHARPACGEIRPTHGGGEMSLQMSLQLFPLSQYHICRELEENYIWILDMIITIRFRDNCFAVVVSTLTLWSTQWKI